MTPTARRRKAPRMSNTPAPAHFYAYLGRLSSAQQAEDTTPYWESFTVHGRPDLGCAAVSGCEGAVVALQWRGDECEGRRCAEHTEGEKAAWCA